MSIEEDSVAGVVTERAGTESVDRRRLGEATEFVVSVYKPAITSSIQEDSEARGGIALV